MPKPSPLQKRPDETDLVYRSRLARMKQEERDRSEPIVPREAEQHARYASEDVMHVETNTIATTRRNKGLSSLVRLHRTGRFDNAQYEAAVRITQVAERIERSVAVRCASLEARVDNSGSARNLLIERLAQVRDEVAYTRWRTMLPVPRRMIIDMLLANRPMSATARLYGKRWETRGSTKGAGEIFIDAIDLWIDLRDRVGKEIDARDIEIAHARIAA